MTRAIPSGRANRAILALIVGLVGVVAVAYLGLGLASASTTLGCDYFTYAAAATRHLDGQALYPAGVARTGSAGSTSTRRLSSCS